jgi:uncharacterized protein (TIGR03435 family)
LNCSEASRHSWFVAASLTLSAAAFAQTYVPPKFEAASIKPAAPGVRGGRSLFTPGGRYTAVGITGKEIIAATWRIPEFQIVGGPEWLGYRRYDISAKAEDDTRVEDFLTMVQSFLADRFQLVVHRETRELPVARKDGKRGTGLIESNDGACAAPGPSQGQATGPTCGRINRSPTRVKATSVSLNTLAHALSEILGRTVINKTGLSGNYDISMEWTPDEAQLNMLPPDAPKPPVNASAPSIFIAIQEQLGLKLESQKGPVEILVVDRAAKPSEN